VDMVRAAGATEVHMRITSPPTRHACFYGIDTPEESKLMAATHTMEEMAAAIGVDSLAFISFDGLYRALGHESRAEGAGRYCDACFTGDYPIQLVDKEGNLVSCPSLPPGTLKKAFTRYGATLFLFPLQRAVT